MKTDGIYRSICTLCHSGCGILVEIKNGRMVGVKPDTEHPSNRNYLCRKVMAIEELSTSPDRIKTPLIRKGDEFVPITWDEAYDYAAKRFSEILENYGPDGIMRCSGAPVSYDARDGFNYFMRVIGSPNATGSSTYCMVPRVTAFVNVMGGKPEPDFDNADYIIMWGSNPKATNRMGGYCAFDGIQDVLNRARKRGAQIVFIDPVRCESIGKEDIWVKVNPGTDLVLAMGMLRHIIINGLYDHEFVENYTIGFEELKKGVGRFTAEYTEEKTGVPASVVKEIAERFAKAKTATLCEGNGLDMYANTVYTVQAVAALCGITGRIDRKGGLVFLPFIAQAPINNLNPATMKQKYRYPLFRDIPFTAVKESLLAGQVVRLFGMEFIKIRLMTFVDHSGCRLESLPELFTQLTSHRTYLCPFLVQLLQRAVGFHNVGIILQAFCRLAEHGLHLQILLEIQITQLDVYLHQVVELFLTALVLLTQLRQFVSRHSSHLFPTSLQFTHPWQVSHHCISTFSRLSVGVTARQHRFHLCKDSLFADEVFLLLFGLFGHHLCPFGLVLRQELLELLL